MIQEQIQEVNKRSAETIVEVEGLTKTFDVSDAWLQRVLTGTPKKILTAVNDVTLNIRRGETLALVGESGCGKSTFARLLAGLYTPTAGQIRIFGVDPQKANGSELKALRRRVNMIFQDPYASLNARWRVSDIVAEPLRVQMPQMSENKVAERVRTVMQYVRLPESALAKYPHQFSGGQRQRISIARALTSRPEFLICDEPTSALDVSVQAQVLNLMKELQRQFGMTYLFISHNLAVVHHMSDRVGVMYLGRLVELADKLDLFDRPLHPYTKMLLSAIPHMHDIGRARVPVAGEVPSPIAPPAGCAFHTRCPFADEKCCKEVPRLQEIRTEKTVRFVACHKPVL